jgi:hypothetical protein
LVFFAVNIGVYAFAVRTVSDLKVLRTVLWWLVIVGVIHNLMVIGCYFLAAPLAADWEIGSSAFHIETGFGGLIKAALIESNPSRFRTFLLDFHVFPAAQNLVSCVCLGLLLTESSRSRRCLAVIGLVLSVFVNTYAEVRAGFLGLLGCAAFLIWSMPQLRKRLIVSTAVCVAGVTGLIIVCTAIQSWAAERLMYSRYASMVPFMTQFGDAHKADEEVGSAGSAGAPNSRAERWKRGVRLFVESHGVGIGTENGRSPTDPDAVYMHSLYISFAQDLGVFGLGIIAVCGWRMYQAYRRLVRINNSTAGVLAIAMCGAVVAIGVQGGFDFVYNDPILWPILGLAVGAVNVADWEANGRQSSSMSGTLVSG